MANIAQLLTEHMAIWTSAETEKRSGRGRASGTAGSVYGVKKLRELILDLAVRGKLVPQDARDEPASVLLKRIQAEKAKLVAVGKLKEEKPLAAIGEDEKSFELPMGWQWARLADLVNIVNGRAYKKEELLAQGVPVLRVGNLFTSDSWYYSDLILEEAKYCNAGDLLFAWSASFGPFIWEGERSIFHYHIWKLDLYLPDQLYKRYLYTFLLEQTQKIKSSGHGVMMIHMTKAAMEKLIVYLPPLAEQHRIVAKVDELMALCDQLEQQHGNAQGAHETLVSQLLATLTQSQNATEFNANWQRIYAHFDVLFTTETSIDALKQTLLQLAVMGKLAPQDATDEPASELLKRIQAEKAKLIAAGKLKKEKPLAAISEDEKPFELPKSWVWVRLGSITNFGITEKLDFISNETWVLDLEDIEKNTSKIFQKNRFSEKQSLSDKNAFKKGDVLYGKLRPYLNKVAIADEDGVCTTEILPVRCYGPFESKYFMYALKAPHFIDYVNVRSYGMKMPRLGTDDGRNSLFPLAPVAEQHRIVAKVDALMALCDQLKTGIQQANQQQQAIANALVAQAV